LRSIQKALDLNVGRIEIDVQQTKDSVVIVMHDETLDRTTNGKGEIKDLLYSDIRQFSAGIKFSVEYKKIIIPTLTEVLRLIDGQATLVIEIKKGGDYNPGIEENVITQIMEYEALNWCIIHSFEDKVLEKIYSLNPAIRLHKLLVWKAPKLPLYFDLKLRFGNLSKYNYIEEISLEYRFLSRSVVKEIHDLGKKVNVWTVNEKTDMQKMIDLGVDGIITDYPDRLLEMVLRNG
jgi:glycerophosphoryl diester phosphodiesterase